MGLRLRTPDGQDARVVVIQQIEVATVKPVRIDGTADFYILGSANAVPDNPTSTSGTIIILRYPIFISNSLLFRFFIFLRTALLAPWLDNLPLEKFTPFFGFFAAVSVFHIDRIIRGYVTRM